MIPSFSPCQVPSADNFCKQFGPRSGPTPVSGWVMIQTVWHSDCVPERFFSKKFILKKSADDKKLWKRHSLWFCNTLPVYCGLSSVICWQLLQTVWAQIRPDKNVGSDLDQICLPLQWYSWNNFSKKLNLKNSVDDKKACKITQKAIFLPVIAFSIISSNIIVYVPVVLSLTIVARQVEPIRTKAKFIKALAIIATSIVAILVITWNEWDLTQPCRNFFFILLYEKNQMQTSVQTDQLHR